MGILNLLQHKNSEVGTPAAKNTQVFVAETTEGAGENEVLAEVPAIKTAAGTFFRFILSSSRRILGATATEALKELTEAESVTGFKPSTTKAAFVWIALKTEVTEATTWKVEVGAVIVGQIKLVPKAVADVIPLGTFYVLPNETIKLTKTAGKIEKGIFGVTLMN